MSAEMQEWCAKADDDYRVALREIRARRQPSYDAACFHAQQCIEKYLKAALVQHGVTPRKIHDLATLMRECLAWYPLWSVMIKDLELLSQFAVATRYPGETATREKASAAIAAMKRCRLEIRAALQVS
jgi:HEPN domain-containing protein